MGIETRFVLDPTLDASDDDQVHGSEAVPGEQGHAVKKKRARNRSATHLGGVSSEQPVDDGLVQRVVELQAGRRRRRARSRGRREGSGKPTRPHRCDGHLGCDPLDAGRW